MTLGVKYATEHFGDSCLKHWLPTGHQTREGYNLERRTKMPTARQHDTGYNGQESVGVTGTLQFLFYKCYTKPRP